MLFLQYTLLGLILGGVYGIAASGLVLTYTTSGIFNFAHGAIAMLSAYLYWQFRVGWHWSAPLALFVVLFVFAPLLGAVLDVGIMRGLRNTSEVTKITVTIALTIGAVPLANWIWNPLTPRRLDYFFGSDNSVSIFGSRVTYHEFIALGCAVAIALGLRFLFTRSYIGVAMRGVVDDPDLLRLNGGKPLRLATFSWALGAFLAALAGILITPILGGSLDPNQLTLLVIDAFAAAVFGRLRSVPRTFAGAIIIGLADNYVVGLSRQHAPGLAFPRVAVDDPAVHRAAAAALGSAARCQRHSRPRTVRRALGTPGGAVGRHPHRRHVPAPPAHGGHRAQRHEHRPGLRPDRPLPRSADRVRRRTEPGTAGFRGHRRHRRLPRRRRAVRASTAT